MRSRLPWNGEDGALGIHNEREEARLAALVSAPRRKGEHRRAGWEGGRGWRRWAPDTAQELAVRKFRSGKETRTAEKNRHSSMSLGRLSRPGLSPATKPHEATLANNRGRGERKERFGVVGREGRRQISRTVTAIDVYASRRTIPRMI